jgi:predicted tellurium resistance membrane protein TerC
VDNIFVFLMIFTYFAVPPAYQKRVLMIGIIGAIVLRTVMILVGGWLLQQFHWILYVFGAFLLLTGMKMWWAAGQEPDLESNPALKLLRRVMPVSKRFDGEKFFTVENGKRIATPLLLVICLVGLTDVIFAVDSIPAIFAITTDPFIVLTSNVFAILGLRAMYFLLAAVASKFHLLSYGLAVILVFIGTKMLLIDVFKIPVAGQSLGAGGGDPGGHHGAGALGHLLELLAPERGLWHGRAAPHRWGGAVLLLCAGLTTSQGVAGRAAAVFADSAGRGGHGQRDQPAGGGPGRAGGRGVPPLKTGRGRGVCRQGAPASRCRKRSAITGRCSDGPFAPTWTARTAISGLTRMWSMRRKSRRSFSAWP